MRKTKQFTDFIKLLSFVTFGAVFAWLLHKSSGTFFENILFPLWIGTTLVAGTITRVVPEEKRDKRYARIFRYACYAMLWTWVFMLAGEFLLPVVYGFFGVDF